MLDFKFWLYNNEKIDRNTNCYLEFIDFFNKSEERNTIFFLFEFLVPIRFNTYP